MMEAVTMQRKTSISTAVEHELVGLRRSPREGIDDADRYDYGNAVAYSALGDLLSEPGQNHAAGRQQYDTYNKEYRNVAGHYYRSELPLVKTRKYGLGAVNERICYHRPLYEGDGYRQITRVLRDFLPA